MKVSTHKFRADAVHPEWCSICGRKSVAHAMRIVCPHCGAASIPSQAGLCTECGQLVGVAAVRASAPPTNNP